MKKVGLIIGGILLAFIVVLIAVPLFVDVDKYRPQIVSAVNQHINGQVKLGKLKLSLLGGIKVHAEGIEVDVRGYQRPMLGTEQFHLEIPFFSIIAAHPRVVAVLKAPKILLEKNAAGKANYMELMGASSAAPVAAAPSAPVAATPGAPAATPPAPAAPAAPTAAPQVPGILAAASFGLRIQDGDLNYEDAQGKAKYAVDGLDLDIQNLGLTSTMTMSVKAPLKGSSPSFNFGGVVKADGTLTPILAGGTIRSASGAFELDGKDLEFTMLPNTITKKSGMPLSAKLAFEGSDKDILFKTIEMRLFDYIISGKGLVTTDPAVSLRMEFSSNELALEKLQELVPMLKTYGLKGKLGLVAKVEGSASNVKANGDIKLQDGEIGMPGVLKTPLKMGLEAAFTENSFNIVKGDVHGPESDLNLQGGVHDFMAPQFNFAITGKSWNVDKTIVLPQAGAAKQAAAFSLVQEAIAAAPAQNINPMLDMAKNPVLLKAAGTLSASVGTITAYDAKFENVNIKSSLANLVFKINQATLKTFGGQVSTTGEFDLKSPGLTYHSAGKVAGISAKDAFTTYFPKFKNTLDGTTDADWNVAGALYPDTQRLKTLKGTAKLQARDGHLRSVDLKDTIQGAIAKVPFLKNAKAPNLDEGFKIFKADVNFANGTTKVDPIYVLGQGKGLELKGKSTIDEALSQDSYLDVFDPNNILPQELHSAGKPSLALHVTGPLSGPKVDYDYMVKKLASTAGKNVVTKQLGKFLGGSGDDKGGKNDAAKSIGDALKKKFHF